MTCLTGGRNVDRGAEDNKVYLDVSRRLEVELLGRRFGCSVFPRPRSMK